jgi:hypothetical protein
MPYDNEYNQHIAREMSSIYNNHIAYEQLTNDNVHPNDITSQVEGMALRDDHVKGGSGYAAATLHDLGYELTDGTAGVPEVRQRRMGSGMSAGGMSAVAGGYSGGNALNTIGDVAKGVAKVAPYVLPLMGLGHEGKKGKSKSERAQVIAKVMKEHQPQPRPGQQVREGARAVQAGRTAVAGQPRRL